MLPGEGDNEDDDDVCCWDAEAFSIPPRFSTIRINMLDKDSDRMEDDLRSYLKKMYPGAQFQVGRHLVVPELLVVCSAGRPRPQPTDQQLMVDAACGAAVLRGADVYAPGVLACSADVQQGDSVSVFADLDGGCRRGRTQPYDGRRTFVGNGVMQLSRHVIFTSDQPSGVGVRLTEPLFGCPSLGSLCGRRAMLQNLPSALVSRVLDPQPGELVLDMCAAPGGKTTHLAQLMNDQGLLYAFDRTAPKVARLTALIEQLQLSCVRPLRADSTRLVSADSQCRLRARHLSGEPCPLHADGPCLPPFPPASFDRVLLDAPCSGLGQRPRLKAPAGPAHRRSYPPLQLHLLETAAALLRPGGRLVYSTCTLPPAENERQVAAVLTARPELRLQPAEPRLGGAGAPGHGLDADQCRMVQRFTPDPSSDSCDRDTIGFFIASFKKAES